jgi:hypothetical protein
MKRITTLLGAASLLLVVGCGSSTTYVRSPNTALGRVVVYRNGIAYFERSARIEGDTLKLSVPADKVDDFLKSLTVTDAKSGEPAPISYPTTLPGSATGLIDMEIRLSGPSPHDIKLTYVTEAPSWKPSYRVMLANDGKVAIEGWAIIDNTSGEDWTDVRLGVGSSSALSFKFDLKTVRVVTRDTLHAEDLFAVAPPTGGSLYGGVEQKPHEVMELSDVAIKKEADDEKVAMAKPKTGAGSPPASTKPKGGYGPTADTAGMGEEGAGYGGAYPKKMTAPGSYPVTTSPAVPAGNDLDNLASKLIASNKPVIIEGYAGDTDGDKIASSLERANKVRGQLVKRGVPPGNVVAVGMGAVPGKAGGGVKIVEPSPKDIGKLAGGDPNAETRDPIGTSHFESTSSMSVKRGSSAMVSILKEKTEGEVIYYYDPESPRGNLSFPFRAIRIKNPTSSTLDSGPVTVFGEGKFIGEGISEPIPPHSSAFVPFALDRQIVVEKTSDEHDDISRILSVQRGVFSTEVQHTKKMTLTFHNRMSIKAKLSMRHTVASGYKLKEQGFTVERIGSAHVLGVELEPGGKKEVVIEESTPVFKTIDLRSPGGMELVKLFITSSVVDGPLKGEIAKLVKLQQEIGNLEQKVTTMREQMAEYRTRMDELHAQIVTLKLVKTGGPLMKDLEKKLQDMGDRLSKATIDLVGVQEQLMMARIRFQDGVSELTLKKDDDKKDQKKEEKKNEVPKAILGKGGKGA